MRTNSWIENTNNIKQKLLTSQFLVFWCLSTAMVITSMHSDDISSDMSTERINDFDVSLRQSVSLRSGIGGRGLAIFQDIYISANFKTIDIDILFIIRQRQQRNCVNKLICFPSLQLSSVPRPFFSRFKRNDKKHPKVKLKIFCTSSGEADKRKRKKRASCHE